LQPEGRRGGDHVSVSGVDGSAVCRGRAGEMERVGGAQEGRGWEGAEALRGRTEKSVVHRISLPQPVGAIGLELVAQQVESRSHPRSLRGISGGIRR